MIIVYHIQGRHVLKIQDDTGKPIAYHSEKPLEALFEIASKFPERFIAWCEEAVENQVDFAKIASVVNHKAIMVSDLRGGNPVPSDIEFVEESPFAKINLEVTYPTWQMSSATGAIHASILNQLKGQVKKHISLDIALNSIAKKCQSQGLFCYHSPLLNEEVSYASHEATFNPYTFVAQTFKKRWVPFLLLSHLIFERRFPLLSFLKGMFQSRSSLTLDSSKINIDPKQSFSGNTTVDVIIPTMGRATYLYDVLKDFSVQTILPQKIVIVEQNADANALSELAYLTNESWPFKIIHHFIHRTGACNARNVALAETSADWVFFADDDIRFGNELIKTALNKIEELGVLCIAMSCLQKGEKKTFQRIVQWSSFPSGASMVEGTLSRKHSFNTSHEHGYGEDADYGMQLRNAGADILYHPEVNLLHLKAPIGGFRHKMEQPWESEKVCPKPSPTVMLYRLKHTTVKQQQGYKLRLFLRQLNQQKPLHLIAFIKRFQKGWSTAVKWAKIIDNR